MEKQIKKHFVKTHAWKKRTQIHMYTCKQTVRQTIAYLTIFTHACISTHLCVHIHTRAHEHTHTQIYIPYCSLLLKNVTATQRVNWCIRTHKHVTSALTHVPCTHTHTPTHTRSHIHTHTHTHAHIYHKHTHPSIPSIVVSFPARCYSRRCRI